MIFRDFIFPATPLQILKGERLFRPYLSYQKRWMQHFYPQDNLDIRQSSWFYLQKYMLPLIDKHATTYHLQGLELLGLRTAKQPDFFTFQKHFASIASGFSIVKADREIPPKEYFTLIKNKQFPCIANMRPINGVFCTNTPDFWHEAIGHLTALCFKEVQEFYTQYAAFVLAAQSPQEFNQRMAIAWTLMEYGFITENSTPKMFGAALVGSHLAHMRYQLDYIVVEKTSDRDIIESGFYSENKPVARDVNGKLRFFCI